MSDDPTLGWTVQPNEPEAWSIAIEEIRDSVMDLTGGDLEEAQAEMAKRLFYLREHEMERQQAVRKELERQKVGGADDAPTENVASRLGIESWEDFRDHTDENIDYLVDGLIPQGSLVFLASQPKAGKTWLALSLAISVAAGKTYLEQFDVPHASPVLYLALEGHRTDYRTRLGCIARGLGVNPDGKQLSQLKISYQPIGLDLMDPAWRDDLVAGVAETGARIVFVDVLRNGAPKLREDGQGSHDFAVIRTHLAPLLKAGVTVVLVHHFKKSNETTKNLSIGQLMSGSGALFGSADLIVGITTQPKEWENLRVEIISRSSNAPPSFRVQVTGSRTGKFGGFRYSDSLLMSTESDNSTVTGSWERAPEVAKWIKDRGVRVAPKDICSRFNIPPQTLRDHRGTLANLGITYHNEGRFSSYEDTARIARDRTACDGPTDRTDRTAPYRGRAVTSGLESELDEWEPTA